MYTMLIAYGGCADSKEQWSGNFYFNFILPTFENQIHIIIHINKNENRVTIVLRLTVNHNLMITHISQIIYFIM